jgi:hypothetical protein
MASISTDTDVERQGIDRRTLIRRAAIVGAAAWTAPVIIGSLTSPASALVTGPKGCTRLCFNNGNCNFTSTSATCAVFTGCTDVNSVSAELCMGVNCNGAGCKCQGDTIITATVLAGCTGCKIDSWFTKQSPSGFCNTAGPGLNASFVNIPAITTDKYDQVCVNLLCQ